MIETNKDNNSIIIMAFPFLDFQKNIKQTAIKLYSNESFDKKYITHVYII